MSEYIEVDQEIPRFRVNRKVMTDPAVFAVERERIFDHSWLYIGHETELAKPNDYVTRTVAGRPLILARDAKEGEGLGQLLPPPRCNAVP